MVKNSFLCLIFIDDVPQVLTGSVLLFTDGVQLFAHRSRKHSTLQKLQAAFKCSEDVHFPLNAEKGSHVLVDGPTPFLLSLADETAIPIAQFAKGLGVSIITDFKTSLH